MTDRKKIKSPLVYTNNLKNREFDKEAPQIFCSERVTIAERQGASENEKCEAKPMRSKTDSSSCLCISAIKRFSTFLFFSFCFASPCSCKEGVSPEIPPPPSEHQDPWMTSTLLAQNLVAVPPGYLNIQPYFFVTDYYGVFDNHWHSKSTPHTFQFSPQVFLCAGLFQNVDFQITPLAYYTRRQGQASFKFGDLATGFDIQILTESNQNKLPSVTIALLESFPTGKYQNLNPSKNGTDSSGSGSYSTTASLTISRLFEAGGHYFDPYLSFQYTFSPPVHVSGFNTYGGGFGTKGRVNPADTFYLQFGGEATLSQNWVFGLDVINAFGKKTTFSGEKGIDAFGNPAVVGGPSFVQISLAPQLEYNFSEEFAIIGGVWFTVAGKNTSQFTSGMLSIYWYFPVNN
jgi:hypothetical protein